MRHFSEIEAMAERHHGGAAQVQALLPGRSGGPVGTLDQGDDRFLAGMAQAVFSAGFNWRVIESKWPGFEAAFLGFDPRRVAFFDDDDLARLLRDERIVRNGAKIRATIENARFVTDIAREHGSVSTFLKAWPASDQIGLLDLLRKRASRLGGSTAQYFLRFNGWDAFILSRDVVAALIREGVIDKPPTSKAALKAVQAAFNTWTAQSRRPQREVSRILSLSVGPS
ncbi:DNA-3-methyladenine glycosylase I [bacterium]|nr:DNA-3-methyladenine glycosylase I [bacterium]